MFREIPEYSRFSRFVATLTVYTHASSLVMLLAIFQNNWQHKRLFTTKKCLDSHVNVAKVADTWFNGTDAVQHFCLPVTQFITKPLHSKHNYG